MARDDMHPTTSKITTWMAPPVGARHDDATVAIEVQYGDAWSTVRTIDKDDTFSLLKHERQSIIKNEKKKGEREIWVSVAALDALLFLRVLLEQWAQHGAALSACFHVKCDANDWKISAVKCPKHVDLLMYWSLKIPSRSAGKSRVNIHI